MNPTLIIHGGAGAREGGHASAAEYSESLRAIVASTYSVLQSDGARSAVLVAIEQMEDDLLFNAGTGSRLQRDGEARMSAALMDSARRRLAGVVNVRRVRHPIQLAERLSGDRHSVLAGEPALAFARAEGFADYDPVTAHRLAEHRRRVAGANGTVGAVAVDRHGIICAGTSTGGIGYETPGRVSDSATVAGTYVGSTAGVSCTGIGEHIVDHAAAARLMVRIDDGAPLTDAAAKTIEEANAAQYRYGFIALDAGGVWIARETNAVTTLFAVNDGHRVTTFDQVAAG